MSFDLQRGERFKDFHVDVESGWDIALIERTSRTLCSPEIGLLKQGPRDEALRPLVLPPPVPRKLRKPQPPPFTHCPVCNADLVALAVNIPADAGSIGYVANAASVRETHVPDTGSSAAPEVLERLITLHASRLEGATHSSSSNEPHPEPRLARIIHGESRLPAGPVDVVPCRAAGWLGSHSVEVGAYFPLTPSGCFSTCSVILG